MEGPSQNHGFPMIGGSKFQNAVIEWSKQSKNLIFSVVISFIFIWAIFTEKIPGNLRLQLSSTAGRLLLLLLLYIVNRQYGWITALVFTIAVAMTWANRPITKPEQKEGWRNMKVSKASPHKWFVEKTLFEEPKEIIQDRVSTRAVQEENTNGSSRTSQSSR
jgi:hypothetical protein